MPNLSQAGAAKDPSENGADVRIAVLSRIVAIALLTPIVGYLLEGSDNRIRQVIQNYYHSELLVFLVGCGVIACVEALAWPLRLPLTKGTSGRLTGCSS